MNAVLELPFVCLDWYTVFVLKLNNNYLSIKYFLQLKQG